MTGSEVTGSEPEPETGKKTECGWLPYLLGPEQLGRAGKPCRGPPTWPLLLAYSEAELWDYLYPLQQIF